MILPSLRQLHYFVALAEQLNFTRAAEACFVSQSTLSASLKELESLLGAQLVERDRQVVMLTPIGHEVAERARALLAATQDMVERVGSLQAPMHAELRLGIIPTIAPFLLPRALPGLRATYPDLRLTLREDLTANLLSRLNDGQLDFALIALPYDTGNLLVEALFDDELWLVGRKNDPAILAKALAATPALSDRLLLLEEGHCLREHTLYACGRPERQSAGAIEATSLLTLVQMVESGLGIGLVPEMAVHCGLTDSPTLATRPLARPGPKRTIALVTRRSTARQQEFAALGDVFRRFHSVTGTDEPGEPQT